MTQEEREKAISLLTRSRQTVREAVAGVTAEEARWTPAPERWCVLQYVEHLALSDDGIVGMVKRIMNEPPTPETAEERVAREERIRSMPMPRGVNRAPKSLQPAAKFASVEEAMKAFEAARERSLEFAQTVEGDLRSHFSSHGVLGPMDGYQWLCANARHAESHAGHIRELRQLWADAQGIGAGS